MKAESLSIKNVTSFKNHTTFQFDKHLNILIGPNGGGKSNTQKIISILLTRYFLPQYVFQADKKRTGIEIAQKWNINDISSLLDRYTGDSSDQEISVTLVVEKSDLENMRSITTNINKILNSATEWHFQSISALSYDQIEAIEAIGSFEYSFLNNQPVAVQAGPANDYLTYLRTFFMIARLADRIEDMTLRSPMFLFSSARQIDINFSGATSHFTESQYYSVYQSVYNAATGGATNLIQFSTRHFGRLMLKAIKRASETTEISTDIFEQEEDVKLVRSYLNKLGYDWKFIEVDQELQNFTMEFYKEGLLLEPNKFSSGEKEIFHFLFAAFALNVEDGVIIIDEPELHLHPRWQRIFLDLFYDLSEKRKNQFILATHSPGFVTPRTIENVTRIYQKNRESEKSSLTDADLPNKRHLVRIINSHNNERLFFADEVILVEGISDRLIFSSLVQIYCKKFAINRTVEVIEVVGKHNFNDYKDLCRGINMPVSVIADRDYLQQIGTDDVKKLFVSDYKKAWEHLTEKKSTDRATLCQCLEKAISNKNYEDLESFWNYIKERGVKLKTELTKNELVSIENCIDKLRSESIYILSHGEIEDYLPEGRKGITDMIELVRDQNWLYEKLQNRDCAIELNKIICRALKVDSTEEALLADSIAKK